MAPDLELHSTGLLEWLYDNSGEGWTEIPGIESYLDDHKLSHESGYALVNYLVDHGLAKALHTLGGADGSITPRGVAYVQRLRADRESQRIPALRARMLLWLDDQERHGTHPASWSGFLTSPEADYHGNPLTESEVAREAEYLMRNNLVTAFSIWNGHLGWTKPALTPAGRDCIVDHGGNVSDYINRSQPAASITNITMSDNSGNIVVASQNVVQSASTGFDTRAVLDFAGFVRQVLPALGLAKEQQDALNTQAAELHAAGDSPVPDRGRLRRLVATILDGIHKAAPTVVKTTAITMGEVALKAITGG